eukprot:403331905
MIANQTDEIIDQIFMDLKQKTQENLNNMINPKYMNTQFTCVEKAENSNNLSKQSSTSSLQSSISSSSSSCLNHCEDSSKSILSSSINLSNFNDQKFQGGRVKQLNNSNYSMYMQDQSGVYDEDGSICRIGSCIQFENDYQTRENNYKGEEIKKLPYRITPYINNKNQERDSDKIIIQSHIQIQKQSQSNIKSELNQFNNTEFNDNKSHISQTCLKTPYIQNLSRKQEIQNSKQIFQQSNINCSITRESQLDILEQESYTDSISSLDLEDVLY